MVLRKSIKKQIKHAARLVDEERHQMQEEKWHAANPKQRERNGDNGQKEEHHYEEQKEKEEEAQKQQTRQVVEEQREEAQQQNDGKTRAADNVQGTAGGATTEVKEVDDFQHPYHPHPDDVERISQQKSSQSGSTTRPASATNEHYKHAHYPTLFEAVEKKRKDLFRKQELIDHGSVVVISSELYVPLAHAWGSFHEPYRSMHVHVCMLRHECVRACVRAHPHTAVAFPSGWFQSVENAPAYTELMSHAPPYVHLRTQSHTSGISRGCSCTRSS